MKFDRLVRLLLFVLFFTAGAAALALSVLVDDLVTYYSNSQYLKTSDDALERLKLLNVEYDALLKRIEDDPNLLDRVAPIILGIQSEKNDNVVYPKMTDEQLAAAVRVLEAKSQKSQNHEKMPDWVIRTKDPRKRIILFLSGASLILIAFICFTRQNTTEKK